MLTQRENGPDSRNDGRIDGRWGFVAAWLLFYGLAALAGIVAIYSERAVHHVKIVLGVWP
jgi:hypothetical protein